MDRYQYIVPTEKLASGITCYKNSKYPIIPLSIDDIYVITTIGDRYDLLAQQYYNDFSLWWIISIANDNLPQNSLYPPVGEQIRIPVDVNSILSEYRSLNGNI